MEAARILLSTRKGLIVFERGASGWKLAAEHLPAAHVSHAFEDSRTGILWAGLDRTEPGGLFISEDGGQTWLCLGTHLPPIYATRFA